MKYFAYGSNMDPGRLGSRGVDTSNRQHAVLKGYSLKFNKRAKDNPDRGFANIVPDRDGCVEGILYEITPAALEGLDRVEGYPVHYDHIEIKVQLGDENWADCLSYVAQPAWVDSSVKPTREYLSHLLAAGDLLSDGYIGQLRLVETLD